MSSLSLSRKRRKRENASPLSQSENEPPRTKRGRHNVQEEEEAVVPLSQRSILSNSQLNASRESAVSAVRCGKVLRIHLTNFMCHSNLNVQFHPRVNFLVGSNGSGKSAVMAALVLGLGGNARATNRSTSLKKLIKTGENSAKIEITISNEGPQAFEADTYGDRISIVRSINQSGATYTIKNGRGHVISRKVDDLHRILMYHNVQVENPVFVLNQDNAREFLKDLDPNKNYKLFLKATQIEMVTEKLNDCLQSHKDQKYHLECFNTKLRKSKEECQELKKRLAQLISLEKLKDDLRKRELERVWVLVTKRENELQILMNKISEIDQKKETLSRAVLQKEQTESALTQKISKFENEIHVKNTIYSDENNTYKQKNIQAREIYQRCTEIQTNISGYKKRISAMEEEIKDLRTNIEERSKQNMGDVAENRRRNECKLRELHVEKEENLALIETTKRDLKIFLDNKMQSEEKCRDLVREKTHNIEKINRRESEIANVKATSKDKLSIFGNHISQLLADIEKMHRAGKFSELPRGPIGRYIEVPSARYRDIVENQIGGLLHSFIVSSSSDRLALENLIRHKYPNYKPTIITTKFMQRVYNVSRGSVAPPRDTCLLMDQIKCSDPVVMNCLIDRARIESVLLTDSKQTAEHITSQHENVPANLSKVIVPQYGIEFFPDPQYRMYSFKVRPAKVIQISTEERIIQMEQEKQKLHEHIKSLEAEYAKILPQLRLDAERIKEKRALIERHEIKRSDLQEKIAELEHYEYPDFNEVDILKNELATTERKLADFGKKLNDKKIELTEALSERERFECDLNEQKRKMHSIQQEIENIKNQCKETEMEKHNLNSRFMQNKARLDEINNVLEQLEKAKGATLQAINSATNSAAKKGERVESDRSEDEILADMQTLKAKINVRAQIEDDPQKLQELIAAKEEIISSDQTIYDHTKISTTKLKKSLLKRFEFVKRLKQHMVMVLQYTFDSCLKLRNFTGSIEVDHEEKKLSIRIVPRITHVENAVSSTKALSGGERSYSTVAFLLSLWSCVDHPFYFLDEYDVFTDEVNREFMTRLLIHEGQEHPQRQYTFLTPQAMSIEMNSFTQIHSLGEPERR